jgi:hypothetical protein
VVATGERRGEADDDIMIAVFPCAAALHAQTACRYRGRVPSNTDQDDVRGAETSLCWRAMRSFRGDRSHRGRYIIGSGRGVVSLNSTYANGDTFRRCTLRYGLDSNTNRSLANVPREDVRILTYGWQWWVVCTNFWAVLNWTNDRGRNPFAFIIRYRLSNCTDE